MKLIFIPLRFLLERLLVVSCLSYETQKDKDRRLKSQQSARFSPLSSKRPRGGAGAGASTRPAAGPAAGLSANANATAASTKAVSRKETGKTSSAFVDDNDGAQDVDMGFSQKAPPKRVMADFDNSSHTDDKSLTFSEKLQASGGLSRKNRAVSFRSSKVALDVNYEEELDGNIPDFSFSTKFASIKRRYDNYNFKCFLHHVYLCIFFIVLICFLFYYRVDVVTPLRKRVQIAWLNLQRRVMRAPSVVWLKLQYSQLKHRLELWWQRKKTAEVSLFIEVEAHILPLFGTQDCNYENFPYYLLIVTKEKCKTIIYKSIVFFLYMHCAVSRLRTTTGTRARCSMVLPAWEGPQRPGVWSAPSKPSSAY